MVLGSKKKEIIRFPVSPQSMSKDLARNMQIEQRKLALG